MNYLRGAVNAISAPYQYYKDINPATLTGAIDVIVITRPRVDQPDNASNTDQASSSTDDTELVCSPFHVRFGKWQVLRPADKKASAMVNVYVNGNLIPFSMKIGDAGEAFFVFETDEDIPEDIVTSPLLEATKPGEANTKVERTGRFGAKADSDSSGSPSQQAADASQEPDFLDLDATAKVEDTVASTSSPAPGSAAPDVRIDDPTSNSNDTDPASMTLLERTAEFGKTALAVVHEVEKAGKDKLRDMSVKDAVKEIEEEEKERIRDGFAAAKSSTTHSVAPNADKGDEILPESDTNGEKTPEVTYGHADMVFDTEGYHSRSRAQEPSEATVTNGSSEYLSQAGSSDATPGPSRSPSPELSSVPFPRATSEPPPDVSDIQPSTSDASYGTHLRASTRRGLHNAHSSTLKVALPETEEYSWEWGNFPQKTPVWTAFGNAQDHIADVKGKKRMSPDEILQPTPDYWSKRPESPTTSVYGSGGLLTVDRKDPTRFRVFIEGRTAEFELSLVPAYGTLDKGKARAHPGSLGGRDEVEDAFLFDAGKVDFTKFLQDDSIISADNLVMRWASDTYITREDNSPLMDALFMWREAALTKDLQMSSRPVSPMSDDDRRRRTRSMDTEDALSSGDEQLPHPKRSVTTDPATPQKKPSSSSWVRWWSRSRRNEDALPEMRALHSEPPLSDAGSRSGESDGTPPGRPPVRPVVHADASESAPALLNSPGATTPDGTPTRPLSPVEQKVPRKRYAKTLRLTSEQLKSLNLKPGANTITFSLSATGVAACTARIFVWEYTDQIVVSDIDGTITKSDALGHVFTMIGRDWTHLGVAKLYTDICRNGYKIMYLTSRAIGQADSTRDYLKGIKQNDYQLPEGPVIMSPDRLMAEVIMRKPEVFKMACLRDIQRLFGPSAHEPFYAGFGNRITDALSYRSVNIPSSRIFTIDSTGEVKMELLELAGYKSSYIHMTDLVDQMFPPINRKWAPEYTDFNYWKTPIPDISLPDLTPPSPALSARSDTSNQSTLARLRNFSLVPSRQSSRYSLPPPATDASKTGDGKDATLRQMSSLERLSNTLSSLRQSSSTVSSPGGITPTSEDSDSESEGEEGDAERGMRRRHHRQRRRSVSSMPGSLPGSTSSDEEIHFGDDDDEQDDEYGYDGEAEEEAAEEAFDEDLLATGEMESVPFL
ncbi:hypothetical protein EIP86_003996 [Pleurotus ostreatoroseus]|nr:hypothetical protein EIP86_003996 [Pleurotus ostreatoroseus]